MIGLSTIMRSLGLGVGLAMDAFSVSIADGLAEPQMEAGKKTGIAGTFALFQFLMPIIGWICVHTITRSFEAFEKAIPWIALLLLLYIGGKMLIEGIGSGREAASPDSKDERGCSGEASMAEEMGEDPEVGAISPGVLFIQGVATSIDALSVGFAFASYSLITAVLCSGIIGAVTFAVCMVGLTLGKRIGGRFTGKAEIVGGVILIIIGVEIFVKGVFL